MTNDTREYVDVAALDRLDAFARQHDWYLGRTRNAVLVIDHYTQKHANGAITEHAAFCSFRSMRNLRDWAGY